MTDTTPDNLISLTNHPRWKDRQVTSQDGAPAQDTPRFAQGAINSWSESLTPTHRTITMSIGLTQSQSIQGDFIMPRHEPQSHARARQKQLARFIRARDFGHDIKAELFPLTDNRIMIVRGEDITETTLLNGPFGPDRKKQVQENDTKSAQAFLQTAGAPYGLSRQHVAKLWSWPVKDTPEVTNNLNVFAGLNPKDIDTTQAARSGLAATVLIGAAEEQNGKTGALPKRLAGIQGQWDKLGSLIGDDAPEHIRKALHTTLPLLVGMAAGVAGKDETDLTLPSRAQAVWDHVKPALLTKFTAGNIQSITEKARTTNLLMENHGGTQALSLTQAAKLGLRDPKPATILIQKASRILNIPVADTQVATAFLAHLTKPEKQTTQER